MRRLHLRAITVFLLLLLLPAQGFAKTDKKASLQSSLQAVMDTAHAKIGIGILGLDFKEKLTMNGSRHFPMQSVFKFPLALAILSKIDAGGLSLQQRVHIPVQSLDTATWSPMIDTFPRQDINLSLADLLRYSVSKSDNNACDALFDIAGGTDAVEKYIHRAGITGIAIKATEREMKKAWPVQYTNWCEPDAMLQLLRRFFEGKLLSKAQNDFLMQAMIRTETGPARIRGGLPKEAVAAHKTGTSATNAAGMKAATNDVGIITLPDGRHYALAVFVSDYKGGLERGERIIATVSRIVWDHFNEHHE